MPSSAFRPSSLSTPSVAGSWIGQHPSLTCFVGERIEQGQRIVVVSVPQGIGPCSNTSGLATCSAREGDVGRSRPINSERYSLPAGSHSTGRRSLRRSASLCWHRWRSSGCVNCSAVLAVKTSLRLTLVGCSPISPAHDEREHGQSDGRASPGARRGARIGDPGVRLLIPVPARCRRRGNQPPAWTRAPAGGDRAPHRDRRASLGDRTAETSPVAYNSRCTITQRTLSASWS